MPRFFEDSDLERAVGGGAQLVQLLDKNRDDVADADLLNYVKDAASNEIASYIQPIIDLDALQPPYPLALVYKASEVGAWYAWKVGSYGQGIPEHIVQGRDAAIQWARDVGTRRATLGFTPKPTLDPPAKLIDHDPNGLGISIAGFKKGFR